MKIGLVCPYNMFRGGGVQECVLALQRELTKRGHKALILTPQPRNVPKKVPKYILLLGSGTDVRSFRTTAQVSVSVDPAGLYQELTKQRFDLLHFHEPWVPILSRQILGRSSSINVATFHAKLPDTVVHKTIEKVITPYTKSILGYFDALTAVSDAAADYAKTVTKQPIEIIPNGIDLNKYTTNRQSKNQPTILFVGRLERRKGLKYLLRVYRILVKHRPDVRLIIAGDGPEKERHQYISKQWGLTNISFRGFVSEKEKLALLSKATVFCSPALYGESFGIVLLEAMAAGLPVVAGDNPGYRAVMQDTGLISLVDPADSQEFARRLQLLLFDDSIRRAWQKWAKKYVQQFDYSKVVDAYERLYEQAIRKKNKA